MTDVYYGDLSYLPAKHLVRRAPTRSSIRAPVQACCTSCGSVERRSAVLTRAGFCFCFFGEQEHINEVSNKHIETIAMKEGDVLLIDNYRVLHGRDVFEGDRSELPTHLLTSVSY